MEENIDVNSDSEEIDEVPEAFKAVYTRKQYSHPPGMVGISALRALPEQAVQFFYYGAKQGEPRAQVYLGLHYLKGVGISQNDSRAAKWFNRAIKQNPEIVEECLTFLFIVRNPKVEGENENLKSVKHFRFMLEECRYIANLSLRVKEETLRSLAEKITTKHITRLRKYYQDKLIPRLVDQVAEYRRDFELFGIDKAYDFLSRLAALGHFAARYHLMMAERTFLFNLCDEAPNDFFTLLIEDRLIEQPKRDNYLEYLFNTHFLKMNLNNQIHIATLCFYRGVIVIDEKMMAKVITAFRYIPEDDAQYGNAQWILFHLCLLAGKETFAKYHFNNYAKSGSLAEFKNITPSLESSTIARCKAEITAEVEYDNAEKQLSPAEFKIWLEAKFSEFEQRELHLSLSEAPLFHEFCFRLAQIYFKENPKVIDYYLDRIPSDHPRFMEAQKLLQDCPLHKQTGRHLTTFYADIRNNNNDISTMETLERETYSSHGSRGRKL